MLPDIGLSESALLTGIAMCVNYYRLFSLVAEKRPGRCERPGR